MVGNFYRRDISPKLKILGSGSNFFVKIQTAHLVVYMKIAMEIIVSASAASNLRHRINAKLSNVDRHASEARLAMTFFQKPLDHFHDSLCSTFMGMKVD